jgi:hypothetical protein
MPSGSSKLLFILHPSAFILLFPAADEQADCGHSLAKILLPIIPSAPVIAKS